MPCYLKDEKLPTKLLLTCKKNILCWRCGMKKKPKRLGVHAGYSGEWKKAIVSLKPSSKTIAFFDSMN